MYYTAGGKGGKGRERSFSGVGGFLLELSVRSRRRGEAPMMGEGSKQSAGGEREWECGRETGVAGVTKGELLRSVATETTTSSFCKWAVHRTQSRPGNRTSPVSTAPERHTVTKNLGQRRNPVHW